MYNPQSLNRYSYVRNNPIRYNDPTGHKECEEINCNSGIDVTTSIKRDLEKTYKISITGNWDSKKIKWLRDSLHKAAKFAGGVDNLNDIFTDAMRANAARENRTPADRLTFDNRKGNDMPKECEKSDGSGGGYACWAYWKDTIVISDYVFTPDYQKGTPSDKGHSTLMAFDKTAPLELAFQETIIHEITHVFADARPQSVGRYSAWALCTNCSQEERMAQSFSVYIANNGVSVPGFDDRFDFVETYRHLWFSNPFPHGLPHT